jgi:endogenous inhibitor of DNA gyrase (YacG/DUF329 family)
MTNVDPGFDRHEFQCPHCEKQVVFGWPGSTVLFAPVTCPHCQKEFVVVDSEPRK